MGAVALILTLFLGQGILSEEDSTQQSSEARRAQEMFQGIWKFSSINDNGEIFGPELIHRAFAQDGYVTIKGRNLEVVNPENGQARVASFRLDPSKSPRQLDLINRHERIYRGIYKFEGENLVVCLERGADGPRPIDFEVKEGSERLLFRLSPTDLKEAPRTPSLSINLDDAPAPSAPSIISERPSSPESGGRRATEAEIRRAHEMLSGEWEILSITDDGSEVGPRLIRAKFAEDGRLRIGTRVASFVTPTTEEKHVSAIRLDPAKSPSWIDLTTQLDTVLKGIYKFDGDQLILCLAKHETNPRPTEFEAPSGSDRALFRMAIAKPTSKPAPAPRAEPVHVPTSTTKHEPTAEEKAQARDRQIREMLVGSWSYADKKGTVTIVLRSDGSFVTTRSWAKAMKRIFEGQTSTSEGRWSYSHGSLTARIESTTSLSLAGHGFSARLQSIGEDSLVFKDVVGELRTARRLR